MNPTQQHQIDAYLRGELNPEQLKEFNGLMEKDPSFAQLVRLEEKIVKGLSDVRKIELKARLNAIDVAPTGWIGVGQLVNSSMVKTLGGVVAGAVLGTLIYINLPEAEKITETDKLITSEVDYPIQEDVAEVNWQVVVESLGADKKYREESEPQILNVALENPVTQLNPQDPVEQSHNNAGNEFNLDISIPEPGDLAKEDGLDTPESDLPEIANEDEVSSNENTPVDVETIIKKNESLKYKYFDGKLYLYGDFKEQPYEILEINGVKDRKLYLYFDKKYFQIDVTDKVKELNQIDHPKLVNELEIIRNNKQ